MYYDPNLKPNNSPQEKYTFSYEPLGEKLSPFNVISIIIVTLLYCVVLDEVLFLLLPNLSDSLLLFLRMVICSIILILTCFKFLRRSFKAFITSIKSNLKTVFIFFALSYLVSFITAIPIVFTDFEQSLNQSGVDSLILESPILVFISSAILAPLCEELIFRGLFFRSIYDKHPIIAYLLTFFTFGFIHIMFAIFTGNFAEILYLPLYGGLGVCMAAAYARSKNIWCAISIHFLRNSTAVLMNILLSSAVSNL